MAASRVRHAAGYPAAGELVRMLAQIAPVGIVQSDADGQCVYANDRWCAMTGTTPDEALGAGWADALHPDDIDRVIQEWERAARHGGELRTDCRLRTAHGGEIWVHVVSVPLPGPGPDGPDGRDGPDGPASPAGEPDGYLAAVWDISDRKLAEAEREQLLAAEQRTAVAELAARELAELAQERLVEQNAKLLELDEYRKQFLATASHELRTPLASIISFCELISGGDSELSPETGQAVGVIERNARRLLRVVGDLLLITRIEAGGLPLDIAAVSVPELVADVASSNAPEAAKQGVQLEVSAGDGPPLQADQERLHQALDNLLSNAIKFTARNNGNGQQRDGLVRITATHDDQAWLVEVADSGIGIPQDELGHVFDRFARGSNAKAASLPGTGLGLSVVKVVAERHGGRVEVDSAEGLGTTFRVYLPFAQ
jgi:PAS domain S-box-containing protein